MELHYVTPDDGDVLALGCTGEIREDDVRQRDRFGEMAGRGIYKRCVLLDMSGASYVDSSGVGWLILANRRFQNEGGRLVLHSLSRRTAELFETLQITNMFRIAPDETGARQLAGLD